MVIGKVSVPQPPFWGNYCFRKLSMKDILPYLNRSSLFLHQWGLKSRERASQQDLMVYGETVLEKLIAQNEREQLISFQAIYGYFPCQSNGNSLLIFCDKDSQQECGRFDFPRQISGDCLCIADFFRPEGSGKIDLIVLQLVTIGSAIVAYEQQLFSNNQYQDYLFWHGFSVQLAAALAEFVHHYIRVELGFKREEASLLEGLSQQQYRGSRYSFGYSACPRLEDQRLLLDLLKGDQIGVSLSETYQLLPEASTSAIIVHHPQAKYFSIS